MLKIIIIDDEVKARMALSNLIKEYMAHVDICAESGDVKESIDLIDLHQPDLILLDVRLKVGTGFDILRQIANKEVKVIFTTAYEEYAIKAIKFAAIDYLLKPIDPDELIAAINRVKVKEKNQSNQQLEVLEELVTSKNTPSKIILSDSKGFNIVNVSDIIRCEGEKNYTTFHLLDHSKITITKSLIEFEKQLSDSNFMRIYKSHLINLNLIKGYKKGKGGYAVMCDNSEVPISREKKQAFMSNLNHILY